MLFNQKKNWLAVSLMALTFISAPALADNDWDDDDRPRATRAHKQQSTHAAKSTRVYKISRAQAKSIAQKRYPSARVTDVDLERKRNGRAFYQVDLEDRHYDYEVHVDANTGKIIYSKRERDND